MTSDPLRLEHFLDAAAAASPQATAVVGSAERLTFGELDELSARLANCLRDVCGCSAGDRVVLAVNKSPRAIVAMHAALRAGCAYVPVDPDSPPARSALVLRAADPAVIVGDRPGLERARASLDTLGAASRPVCVALEPDGDPLADVAARTWLDRPRSYPQLANGDSDVAHILFTSGSTGEPKGVQVTHRSAVAFVRWAVRHFAIAPGERLSGHPPLHFDLSTFDIYGSIHARAELHLVPPQLNVDPRGLARFIRERELVQWFSVPSVLTLLARFDAVADHDFPTLKRLLWCGEVLPTPVLRHWMQRLPHVRFTNLYGPTEATIASSYYDVPALPASDDDEIPIGRPCPGEELLVVREDGSEAAVDEVGEIWIAGVGLSPGYWRDAERTRRAFVAHPRAPSRRCYRTGDLGRRDRDGLFFFHGRRDAQIKHRGYRIELGEIEAALNKLDAVRECAVVGVPVGGVEGTAICAAWSRRPQADADHALLRRELAELLPRYMLPTRWLELPELPKNVNGKIDRRALVERFRKEVGR